MGGKTFPQDDQFIHYSALKTSLCYADKYRRDSLLGDNKDHKFLRDIISVEGWTFNHEEIVFQ